MAELCEFQDSCHVEPHKILKPSQTRWLSLTEGVKRMSTQWEALQLFFTEQWIDARLNADIYHALNDESALPLSGVHSAQIHRPQSISDVSVVNEQVQRAGSFK